MVAFECDNTDIEKLVRRQIELVRTQGGFFADHLVIRCANGYFSVASKAPEANKGAPAIRLPESCLVPVDDVTFGVNGDEITIKSAPDDMSAVRRELLDIMLALYNHTGKLPEYRGQALWYKFADRPEILDRLCEGRERSKVQSYREESAGKADEELLAQNFIDTRILSTLLNPRAATQTLILMPVIDFLNHHPQVRPFQMRYNKERGAFLEVATACPLPDSDEILVRYGRYDAYDTLMVYNFVDGHAPFVRSVPLEISLPVGTIKILGQSNTVFHNKLPEQIADLRAFLPSARNTGDKTLEASYLLIPSVNSPYALRRVLGYLINILIRTPQTRIGLGQEQMKALIEDAEAQVLKKNDLFYDNMHNFFAGWSQDPAQAADIAPIMEMISLQKDRLAGYPLRDKARIKQAV